MRTLAMMTSAAIVLNACTTGNPAEQTDEISIRQSNFNLTAPDGRDVSLRAFVPVEDCSPCSLIIFSHGAYATYDRYDVLLTDWAERGYVVVAPLHVDSEEHPDRSSWTMDTSRPARLEDYALVSSTFAADGYTLGSFTFNGRQIAAGHSYGGLIAQVAGGATLDTPGLVLPEAARAPEVIIAISPPSELDGLVSDAGFSNINTPMLVITGTTDVLPGFIDDWRGHLDGYEAAPDALAYALVYDGMDHYFNGAFGRETQQGFSAQEAVDDLNARIADFIEDALAGKLPAGADWNAESSELVETMTRQGDL